MVYDVGGLFYRVWWQGFAALLISGLVLLIVIIFQRRKKSKKDRKQANKKDFIIPIIAMIVSSAYMFFFLYKANHPKIISHEGYFVRENRHRGMEWEYCFTNGDEKKKIFYIDSFTRKDIYAEDFSSEIRYRVYYEEDTKIILRIEEIG